MIPGTEATSGLWRRHHRARRGSPARCRCCTWSIVRRVRRTRSACADRRRARFASARTAAQRSLGAAERAVRLELAELVGKEAPAVVLGVLLALDDRAAVDAADEPVEHAQRRRTAQAVRARDRCGRRADRPAVLGHAGLRRRCGRIRHSAPERAVALRGLRRSCPPLSRTLRRIGRIARGGLACGGGCEVPPNCGNLVGSAPTVASPPAPPRDDGRHREPARPGGAPGAARHVRADRVDQGARRRRDRRDVRADRARAGGAPARARQARASRSSRRRPLRGPSSRSRRPSRRPRTRCSSSCARPAATSC